MNKGSQFKIEKKGNSFLYLKFFLPEQTVKTLMKRPIMRHFNWGFTVCKNTHLGVPTI